VDARSYSKPGSTHIVDDALADRVLESILKGLTFQAESNHIGVMRRISDIAEDYVIGPSLHAGNIAYLMGPPAENIMQTCTTDLLFANYRKDVLRGDAREYCSTCGED